MFIPTTETILVTEYVRPNARKVPMSVEVLTTQADYLKENNVKLSYEKLNGTTAALYADTGKRNEDGDPDETILLLDTHLGVTKDEIGRMIVKIEQEK